MGYENMKLPYSESDYFSIWLSVAYSPDFQAALSFPVMLSENLLFGNVMN